MVRQIYEALYPVDPIFNALKIVQFLDKHPQLVALNNWMKDAFIGPESNGKGDLEVLNLQLDVPEGASTP